MPTNGNPRWEMYTLNNELLQSKGLLTKNTSTPNPETQLLNPNS